MSGLSARPLLSMPRLRTSDTGVPSPIIIAFVSRTLSGVRIITVEGPHLAFDFSVAPHRSIVAHIYGYRGTGTKYRVQSTEYRVQSTEYKVQSTEYRVQSTEYRVQRHEVGVQNTEYRVQRHEVGE